MKHSDIITKKQDDGIMVSCILRLNRNGLLYDLEVKRLYDLGSDYARDFKERLKDVYDNWQISDKDVPSKNQMPFINLEQYTSKYGRGAK